MPQSRLLSPCTLAAQRVTAQRNPSPHIQLRPDGTSAYARQTVVQKRSAWCMIAVRPSAETAYEGPSLRGVSANVSNSEPTVDGAEETDAFSVWAQVNCRHAVCAYLLGVCGGGRRVHSGHDQELRRVRSFRTRFA